MLFSCREPDDRCEQTCLVMLYQLISHTQVIRLLFGYIDEVVSGENYIIGFVILVR
jgi:hypothetical protein